MASILRLLTATVVIVALAGPASATAANRSRAKAAAPVALAAAVARDFWNASPCAGKVTVLTGQPLAAGLGRDSDAWATFSTLLGANVLAAPAETYANCTVSLASTRWPSPTSMRQDWDMLCMTMIHEYGHLLGRAHDLTGKSVMAAAFTDYSNEPRACRDARPGRPRSRGRSSH